MAIITFLTVGWILNWFEFERLFIQAFKELFGKDVTKSTYYCTCQVQNVEKFQHENA